MRIDYLCCRFKVALVVSLIFLCQGCVQVMGTLVLPELIKEFERSETTNPPDRVAKTVTPDIPFSEATKCFTDIPSNKGRVFTYHQAVKVEPYGAQTGLYINGEYIGVGSEKFYFVDVEAGSHTFFTMENIEQDAYKKTIEIIGGQPYFIKLPGDGNIEVVDQKDAEQAIADFNYLYKYKYQSAIQRTGPYTPPCLKSNS